MIDRELSGKLSDSKIDESKLCLKLTNSANKVVTFLQSKLKEDGSYGRQVQDIACYFKSPMMFIAADKPEIAANILTYIKNNLCRTMVILKHRRI